MLKTLVNKYLKAALDELFIDGGKVFMSMGTDLFSDSSIDLSNLTFRPDLFDIYLQPLRLISGHLSKLTIEGIAELALSMGKVRCQVDEVFLLFEVDGNMDAERAQVLKKLLLELQGRGPIARTLLGDLLKRIQGISTGKDPDMKKKRKSLLKGLNYVLKNVMISIKTVHIRIETSSRKNAFRKTICSGIGMTIANIKIYPNEGTPPNSTGGAAGAGGLHVVLKGVQVYCDYDAESYTSGPGTTGQGAAEGAPSKGSQLRSRPSGGSLATAATAPTPAPAPAPATAATATSGAAFHARVYQHFASRWKSEVHTGMVLPFDVTLLIPAEVNRRTGLLSAALHVAVPRLRVLCDPKQLEVITRVVSAMALAAKRIDHLVRVRGVFGVLGGRAPPRVCEMGGIHLLPALLLRPSLLGRAGTGTGNGNGGGNGNGTGNSVAGNAAGVNNSTGGNRLGTDLPLKYPTNIDIPRHWGDPSPVNLLHTLKALYPPTAHPPTRTANVRAGRPLARWAVALWQHLISLVLSDVRRARPVGRWVDLARVAWARQQYAFLYSRLLRRSADTGHFVFNVQASLDVATAARLFEYEMVLPVQVVVLCRTLASMVSGCWVRGEG